MLQAFWGYSFARTQGAYSVHRALVAVALSCAFGA